MAILDLAAFHATKRPCPDDLWELIKGEVSEGVTQDICLIYADGYLIHELEGRFWVNAWWYSPLPYDTLEEAEAKLHPWYLEFAE